MAAHLAARCPADLFKGLYSFLPRDVAELGHELPSASIAPQMRHDRIVESVEKAVAIEEVGENGLTQTATNCGIWPVGSSSVAF